MDWPPFAFWLPFSSSFLRCASDPKYVRNGGKKEKRKRESGKGSKLHRVLFPWRMPKVHTHPIAAIGKATMPCTLCPCVRVHFLFIFFLPFSFFFLCSLFSFYFSNHCSFTHISSPLSFLSFFTLNLFIQYSFLVFNGTSSLLLLLLTFFLTLLSSSPVSFSTSLFSLSVNQQKTQISLPAIHPLPLLLHTYPTLSVHHSC